MDNTNSRQMHLNQFEYAYLVEDTDPCARVMKVECPKLTAMLNGGNTPNNESVDKGLIVNDTESTVNPAGSVTKADYIVARVVLEHAHRHKFHDCIPQSPNCVNKVHGGSKPCKLKPCKHHHHDHHFPHLGDFGKIPKGTKVIVMFMDNNPNDCYVTRLWCEFPDGTTQGQKVREIGR